MATGAAPSQRTFASQDIDALKTNYGYLTRTHFDSLRGDILSAAGGPCPYCHQYKANEIDHFLPKANFGEYSIYSANLVPICTRCNKKKSNRFSSPATGRRYVHPYFDLLPTGPFLQADLSVGTVVTIQFSIVQVSGMTPATAARLQTQFDDLGLKTSYGEEAMGEMMARLGSLYAYFKAGGSAAVARYLQIDHLSVAKHLGLNHWRTVTLAAIAHSPAFCDGGFAALGPDPLL